MQNFSPYHNYYPQFWILPNGMIAQYPLFPQVPMHPQIQRVQTRTASINSQCNKSVAEKPIELSNIGDKKEVRQKAKSKKEDKKLIVILDSISSNEVQIISDIKKVQRPRKYLTEKAYYMKQKLKGKQKSQPRILRTRFKQKEKIRQTAICPLKNMKKSAKFSKKKQKMMPIIKDSEKQKKVLEKIQFKLCHQYRDDFAEIPNQISGVAQLNEFCRLRALSLQSRRLKRA